MADSEYKAILVKNEAANATVFVDVYSEWDPICCMAIHKKSIEPGKKYFYRDKHSFKYKLRVLNKKALENKKTETILSVKNWKGDKLILVMNRGDSFICSEEDLSEYPEEQQICIRRKNMEDETSFEYGRNFYAILKLDMKEVRKHTLEEQDKMIKKAYHKQMLIFHPDRNPDSADSHICQEIIIAYSILGDRKKRAQYHDLTDYSGGWLSRSRWKAIFKPEAHGSDENIKRIGLLLFSAAMLVGGFAVTLCTSGLGQPALLVAKLVASNFFIFGSLTGARTVASYDVIQNGVDVKKYAKDFVAGGILGVACGAVGVGFGIAAGVATDVAVDVAVDAAVRGASSGVVGVIADGGAGVVASVAAGVAAGVAASVAAGVRVATGDAASSAADNAAGTAANAADRSAADHAVCNTAGAADRSTAGAVDCSAAGGADRGAAGSTERSTGAGSDHGAAGGTKRSGAGGVAGVTAGVITGIAAGGKVAASDAICMAESDAAPTQCNKDEDNPDTQFDANTNAMW